MSKSFQTGLDSVVSVKIKPESTASFINAYLVSEPENKDYWFIDYVYSTDGIKTIELEIKYGAGPSTATETKQITVLSELNDYLFSSDAELIGYQHDIMKYLPEYRSSWNFCHRISQNEILAYLDESGKVNEDGSKITKDQIVDLSEVRALATFKTLRIIYESLSNAPDDFFIKRASHWASYEAKAQLRCVSRIDFNKNGIIDKPEEVESNLMIQAGRA